MSFFQNTCSPKGFGGKLMVAMMNTGHTPLAKWGFRHIEIAPADFSLDIGCGGGANVKRLLEKSPQGKVTGVDYSIVSVEKSKKVNQFAVKSGRCEILQANVLELPFACETFHTITAFETVYFWPEISKSFAEVHRILKKDGIFMICNECDGENPKNEKWTRLIEGMHLYSFSQIQKFLKEAGFNKIKKDSNEKGWLCVIAKK